MRKNASVSQVSAEQMLHTSASEKKDTQVQSIACLPGMHYLKELWLMIYVYVMVNTNKWLM